MKTRNFIAVLVLMLGAFSMVIGQNNTFKVTKIESYFVNLETGEETLTNVSRDIKYIYLNTSTNKMELPYPSRDSKVLVDVLDYSVKYEQGEPVAHLKIIDKYGKRSEVFADRHTMRLSFRHNGAGVLIVYHVTKI